MEKVKVSKEVAEAYEELSKKHDGNGLAVIYEWSEKLLPHKTQSPLKLVDFDTMLFLLTGQYEVEKTPYERLKDLYDGASIGDGVFYDGFKHGVRDTLHILGITVEGVND